MKHSTKQGNKSIGWVERLFKRYLPQPKSLQELIKVLRATEKKALINNETLSMLEGVLCVTEKQVRDIMVPRPHMIVIEGDSTVETALPIISKSGHSRFPIVNEEQKQVTGILLAKDLLKVVTDNKGSHTQINRLARPITRVPESQRLDALLNQLRQNRNHMGIVIDEYGRTAGLVTIEDILEEIVGDIEDEHDTNQTKSIQPVGDDINHYIIKALTPIEEFNQFFNADFAHDDFDTISGLLLKEHGSIPKRKQVITIGQFEFTILESNRRGINKLKLKLLQG